MERFKALKFKQQPESSCILSSCMLARMYFPNGYTAQVIQGPYSLGGKEGLYELALMRDSGIVFGHPFEADGVHGHQTESDIDQLLGDILSLPDPGATTWT